MTESDQGRSKSRRALWPAVFAAAAVISGVAMTGYPSSDVRVSEQVIASRSGNPIRTVLFLPRLDKGHEEPMPGVVAVPPYSVPPEGMEVICMELAARGATCAVPDFFGKSRAESRQRMGGDSLEVLTLDALSIAHALRTLPFVDPHRIGACGHSIGGTVVVLAGIRAPWIRAVIPIGMESSFLLKKPKNLLFLSGLYDEIHSPRALLDNLSEHEVTDHPENGVTYGSMEEGTARMVSIIHTTDHFIETFDPLLIRELLWWFSNALSEPGLAKGPLRAWNRRVAGFIFMVSAAFLYALIMGRWSAGFARRMRAGMPDWLIMRLQALPVVLVVGLLWGGSLFWPGFRPAGVDLLLALALCHELASHRARGVLRLGERSPMRNLRTAALALLALGAGALISFGIVSAPEYLRMPEAALSYPRFVLHMIVLFPLEVWGRVKPWFFQEMTAAVEPGILYYILLAAVVLAPGSIIRGADRVASELTIALRGWLKPLGPSWKEAGPKDKTGTGATPVRLALLGVLLLVLGYFLYRRVAEGMLTQETAMLALMSILRFAVLPFVIAALFVRTRWFRKISLLD